MNLDPGQIIDTIEFPKTTYYFRQDGIVIIRIKPDVHLEVEDSKAEQEMLYREKAHLMPMKVMIIPGEGASVSKEARDYSNAPENTKMIKAEAIVVNALAHKIMANFITKFYKIPMPVKVFNNEKKALDWLINFK